MKSWEQAERPESGQVTPPAVLHLAARYPLQLSNLRAHCAPALSSACLG